MSAIEPAVLADARSGPKGFSVDLEGPSMQIRQSSGGWAPHERALERQVDYLLELLENAGASATFFTVASLAKRQPEIVRRIAQHGHEIGCHSLHHDPVPRSYHQSFAEELRAARCILEDVTGVRVDGYRAPFFSVQSDMQWAHQAILEQGFRYDASVICEHTTGPRQLENGLWQVPVTVVRHYGRRWPFGSSWIALLPQRAAREATSGQAVFYMHPYNLGWNFHGFAPPVSLSMLSWRLRRRRLYNLLGPRFRERLKVILDCGSWGSLGHWVSHAESQRVFQREGR